MDKSAADGTRCTKQRRYLKSLPMGTMAANWRKRRRRYVAVFLGSSRASCGLPVPMYVWCRIKAQWCVENLIRNRGGCRFVGCYLDDDGSSRAAPKTIKTLCHRGCRFVGGHLDDDGSSCAAPKTIKTLCHSKRKEGAVVEAAGFRFWFALDLVSFEGGPRFLYPVLVRITLIRGLTVRACSKAQRCS